MKQKRNFTKIVFLCVFLLAGLSVFAQDSTLIDLDSAYYAQKQAANPFALFSAGKSGANLNGGGGTTDHNSSGYDPSNLANRLPSESCIIPTDATWSFLPGNDDGSTGVINLGFTFNFYGTSYTQCYIIMATLLLGRLLAVLPLPVFLRDSK